MEKTKNLLCVFALLFVVSCSNDFNLGLSEVVDSNKQEKQHNIDSIEKLPIDIDSLVSDDAAIVANLFNFNRGNTRSENRKTIKKIIPIPDKLGSNAIFAVNFWEGGYLLVSATTKFFPILGIVDEGEYSDRLSEIGQEVLIEDMIENIQLAKKGQYDFDCHVYWNEFLEKGNYVNPTRSSDDDFSDAYTDQYWEAYGAFLDSQDFGYYKIYKLTGCKSFLPEDVYAAFVNAAKTEDLWEGTQFSWENTAYVVERTQEDNINEQSLLSTKWDQGRTFNSTRYETLGCVTVAVGQLMRYFEYPKYYDWKSMPNSYGNDVLRDFLSTLRDRLKVSSGGSATDSDAIRVLSDYGYDVSHRSHDASEVFRYLKEQRRPIYASGQRSDNIFKGHAWIIDGLYYRSTNVVYTLFRLADTSYPNFRYDNAEAADPWNHCTTMTLYHMNWGWGGQCDGWFIDDRIDLTSQTGDKRNYSKFRKEIYVNNL